eukprot:jgi/Galph1/1995/GphlegSOOS_G681.1
MGTARQCPLKVDAYETPEIIQEFESIVVWMKSQSSETLGFEPNEVTASMLARLTGELNVFQEMNLGKNSPIESRIMTKLPQSVFRNKSPQGALCKLLCLCMQLKNQMSWRRLDVLNPDRKETVMSLLLDADKTLKTKGLVSTKKIFFSRSVPPSSVPKLKSIVQKHGGLCNPYHEPDIDSPSESEDQSNEEYCRVTAKKDDKVFVHWWYYPDSYDSWIPASEVEGSEVEEQPPEGPWHVQVRFILDLEKFNEWPNEFDYEVPEDMITRTIADNKRTSELKRHQEVDNVSSFEAQADNIEVVKRRKVELASKDTASARFEKEDMQVPNNTRRPEETTGISNSVASQDKKQVEDNIVVDKTFTEKSDSVKTGQTEESHAETGERENANAILNMQVENVSEIASEAVQKAKERNDTNNEDEESFSQSISKSQVKSEKESDNNVPDSGNLIAVLPEEPVTLPSYSRWFRMDSIHDIEKKALEEFFSGQYPSKTPEVYMQYRNFMVQSWRADPKYYLTVTAVRRHLAGDACAIMRIHAFLEHWGLINFSVDASMRPSATNFSSPPVMPLASHGTVTTGIPRLLFFDDGSHPDLLERSVDYRLPEAQMTRRELYATAAAVTYRCDACGSDCSKLRYHCINHADMDLCPTCFSEGKYPSEFTSDQFVPMKSVAEGITGDERWSENETFLLLEALEMYGENWDAVAEHVGTKSKEACVLQFIRLPIEDEFLDEQLGNDYRLAADGKEDLESFVGEPLPFADTANPIMAQIAFLTSMVSPEVASAAAQAALATLMKKNEVKRSSERLVRKSASETVAAEMNCSQSASMKKEDVAVMNESKEDNVSSSKKQTDLQVDAASVQAAAAVALAAAGARGKLLADEASREIERLFAVALEAKLKMLDMKMDYFDELEALTRREREKLERFHLQVIADRLSLAFSKVSGKLPESSSIFKVSNGEVKEECPFVPPESPTEVIPSTCFEKGPRRSEMYSALHRSEYVGSNDMEQNTTADSFLIEENLSWNTLPTIQGDNLSNDIYHQTFEDNSPRNFEG